MQRWKTLFKDGRAQKWSLLQYLLAIIDQLINPTAYDYPFAVADYPDATVDEEFKRGKLIVRRFNRDGKTHAWFIRWGRRMIY